MECSICSKPVTFRCKTCKREYCSKKCSLYYHYRLGLCTKRKEEGGESSEAKRRVVENLGLTGVEIDGVPLAELPDQEFAAFRVVINLAELAEASELEALCYTNKAIHRYCQEVVYTVSTWYIWSSKVEEISLYPEWKIKLALKGIHLLVQYERCIHYYRTEKVLPGNEFNVLSNNDWDIVECALASMSPNLLKYVVTDHQLPLLWEKDDGHLIGIAWNGTERAWRRIKSEIVGIVEEWKTSEDEDETYTKWFRLMFAGRSTYIVKTFDPLTLLFENIDDPDVEYESWLEILKIVLVLNKNNEEMLSFLMNHKVTVDFFADRTGNGTFNELIGAFSTFVSTWDNANQLFKQFLATLQYPQYQQPNRDWPPWIPSPPPSQEE